jgi:drug/metabolite transporter (DMT)-like permease
LLGIVFVHEPPTWNLIVGTALILAGLWIAERNPDEREAAGDTLMFSKGQSSG